MPAPLAKGIIITVSVLIAAGLAAYESPEVRKWVNMSRQKIAMALHSLGDEISPNVKANQKPDPSMDEEKTDEAEERRRKAREEIMERGRLLEERKRQKSSKSDRDSGVGSFDSLVDENGNLLRQGGDDNATEGAAATSTAVEQPAADGLTKRQKGFPDQIQMQPLGPNTVSTTVSSSNYENELRENWNLPLPPITTAASQTSHASESLLDLTPTSEFPDPDFSVPNPSTHSQSCHDESQFFSVPNLPPTSQTQDSRSRSHTVSPEFPSTGSSSYYYAHPSSPEQPLPDLAPSSNSSLQIQQYQQPKPTSSSSAFQPLSQQDQTQNQQRPTSSLLSIADSSDLEHIHHDHHSDGDNDTASLISDDLHSMTSGSHLSHADAVDYAEENENSDGVRTPGSLWTDVDSVVSGGD